ncbi:MAG: hypothetical protein JRG80_19490, partial [Deltaproteobacteria bacterium]|nr:hypothetical protein [Deltaproteobacteria bacterium]
MGHLLSKPLAFRGRSILAIGVLVTGVLGVYCPPTLLSPESGLYGMDFWALHLRRLDFVHEQLSGSSWALPGWYPRELFGTPFWSNLQNFPWIPTRLVLLLVEPAAAYGLGVNLAAVLAACFTYLYGRSIGWGRAASVLAGWTFACAGFFAARVTVGHLPLLEAYAALPLLLWLVERTMQSDAGSEALAALALGTACVVVAGHPQLPAYAVASALLYLFWMARRRHAVKGACAIGLGIGSTLVIWWPMLQLLQRSTRTLPLQPAFNDLPLPYTRFGAFVLPWKDGWPSEVQRIPPEPFSGFPSTAYFWETVGYVGVLPLLAALGLLIALRVRRRRPGRRAVFFATLGAASLLLALPFVKEISSLLPGTFLRSPARLLYLTTFVLSLAAGAALETWLRSGSQRGTRLRALAAAVVVLLHTVDLAAHDRVFIRIRPRALQTMPSTESFIAERLGSGRVAIDYHITLAFNRRFDDVGFFDSILLARPYRALLELGGIAPDVNVQDFRASMLSGRALSNLGIHYVLTTGVRNDLPVVFSGQYPLYAVPDPLPRVAFFPPDRVQFLSEADMHPRLEQDWFRLGDGLMLPREAREQREAGAALSPQAGREAEIEYRRPSPDRIALVVDAPRQGFIRILESWDPGWKASIDGVPVSVLRADTFAIAVAVGPGKQRVELEFETPGARAGAGASLASLLLLSCLLWWNRRSARPGS